MKTLLLILLSITAYAQEQGIRAVVVSVPYQSQAQVDTAQNQKLRDMSNLLSSMNVMTKTLSKADSTNQVMLGKLSVDSYITLPGNLTGLLGTGLRQQVRNTTNANLHEIWVGTPDGNRLLTMRGGVVTVTVQATKQVIAIPHGLGYTPAVFSAHILDKPSTAYTLSATSTFLILTLPSFQLSDVPYTISWLAR